MINDAVKYSAEKYPQNIALKYKDQGLSYSQLHAYIKHFSLYIGSLEAKEGERILLFLPNCPEFIIAFFGITQAGCTAILTDIKYNEELRAIVKDNAVRFVITNRAGMEKLAGFIQGLDIKYILTEEKNLFYPERMEKYQEGTFSTNNAISLDHTAMILYTSGSTGNPKGVVNSHGTLLEALKNYTATLAMKEEDRLVAVTPFFHSYAFGSCLLAGLSKGATLLIQDVFQPRQLLKMMTKERATIFHGVPYMYNLLMQHYNPKDYDLSALRFCISAGAPLTKDIANGFYELAGKMVHQEYGSSETGTIALNLSHDRELGVRSVGRALENVKVRVLKNPGEDIGRIQVKSLGHSIGYVGKEPFTRDWFSTGDLGRIDEEGFIHILGREKRIINIAGLKVNPAEIEALIATHPKVAEVYVRGSEHKEFGEIVEALVVRRDEELHEEELIRFCQKHLALYKVPRKVSWVPSIPKSSTGKIMNEKI